MPGIEFENPLALILLLPLVYLVYRTVFQKRRSPGASVLVSSKNIVHGKRGIRARSYPLLNVLRIFTLFFLVVALSGPGRGLDYTSVKNRGIDIIIALDLSGSMRGEDFQPKNRLTVARKVVKDFIDRRGNDRIGLVVFAGEAYLQCPLTVEHDMLKGIVDELDFGTVEVDGTAVGDSIALSASRMMDSSAKSRVVLLITDGMNNRGSIDPETAARTCADMGIKVYSVGIGKKGKVPFPGNSIFGKRYLMNHFDETELKKVSDITGGKFYRADSTGLFWEKIQDIDRLEKSDFDLKVYHDFESKAEVFTIFAISLFLLEVLLRSAFYRKVP